MGSYELQYLIERCIEQDRIQTKSGEGFSYVGLACIKAEKYMFDTSVLDLIEAAKNLLTRKGCFIDIHSFSSIWIEVPSSIPSPDRKVNRGVTGVLFFSPKHTYNYWRRSSYAGVSLFTVPSVWNEWQWALVGFDVQGKAIVQFACQIRQKTRTGQWMFTSSHICPYEECQLVKVENKKSKRTQRLIFCPACNETLQYWSTWLSLALYLINEKTPISLNREQLQISIPSLSYITTDKNKAITMISDQTSVKQHKVLPVSLTSIEQLNNAPEGKQELLSEPEVHLVQQPLMISRYINKQRERMNQNTATLKQQQQAAQAEVAIDHSHKYLWMQSAWAMTEALQHNTDGTLLQLPENHIYIELEQPHQLHERNIAAFSFLLQQEHCWAFSLIDPAGQTIWKALYENKEWKLPQGYICPQQECQTEEHDGVITYVLCSACQEHIHHYTSWITTALRMIHGDFQEEVEVKEPEYVVETTKKRVYDNETKQVKEMKVRYRYRVIRYFDASISIDKQPHTRRNSWMDGRPVARDANEMNLEAIIYVRIQPKEHDRTYRHQRYTNARGKTQHIEPPSRLQPMTIATFRQLPRVQRITRVLASKFDI